MVYAVVSEQEDGLTLPFFSRVSLKSFDPHDALVSLPGVRHILAGSIRSAIGDIDRFPSVNHHRGYAGLYPTAKGTGDHRAKGTAISKMSSSRAAGAAPTLRYGPLRVTSSYMAADNAYKWDLEMAAFYHKRRRSGHTHTQAVCAVANAKLIPRLHHMLKNLKRLKGPSLNVPHYVFRDLSGNPISKKEAKGIIKAEWGHVEYN